jgi:two-component system, NtrC family, sensor kinase
MRDKSLKPLADGHASERTMTSDMVELGRVSTDAVVTETNRSTLLDAETNRSTLLELPSSWLDRLILLSAKIPVDEGAEGALRAVVRAVAAILPEHSVGARLAAEGGARPVVYSEPPTSHEQPRTERLFPEALHERVIGLPTGGAWLHLAGSDPTLDDDRAPAVLLVERAATVASDGLARVKSHEQFNGIRAELDAMKRSMVQAEKLASLGQMAAGIVHELNNPLTSIVAYTDFMLRRTANFEEQDAERIRRIAESANRMLRFTRDLVSYARPSSELPVPVALHGVIDRAIAFCEHEIALAGVIIEREFDPRVTAVTGKPEQLAQVFVNLVTNACHAMATDGVGDGALARLTVKTERVGEATVRIIVDDTGHGISQANLPRVFAPFFTTKGAGRGTGLGLSIVKTIVEGHLGEITVESDASHGTRFVLLLPLVGD